MWVCIYVWCEFLPSSSSSPTPISLSSPLSLFFSLFPTFSWYVHLVKQSSKWLRRRFHKSQEQLIKFTSFPLEPCWILPKMPVFFKIKRFGLNQHISKLQVKCGVCVCVCLCVCVCVCVLSFSDPLHYNVDAVNTSLDRVSIVYSLPVSNTLLLFSEFIPSHLTWYPPCVHTHAHLYLLFTYGTSWVCVWLSVCMIIIMYM